jgi:hypothetical protein
MAGIITLMPKHLEAWKPFLTLLTPILSVAFGGLFLLAQFYFDRMKIDRLFKALIKQTRAMLRDAENDPNSSPEHKRALRKMLENFERSHLESIHAKIVQVL